MRHKSITGDKQDFASATPNPHHKLNATFKFLTNLACGAVAKILPTSHLLLTHSHNPRARAVYNQWVGITGCNTCETPSPLTLPHPPPHTDDQRGDDGLVEIDLLLDESRPGPSTTNPPPPAAIPGLTFHNPPGAAFFFFIDHDHPTTANNSRRLDKVGRRTPQRTSEKHSPPGRQGWPRPRL